jgi:phage shock protein C
MRANDRALRRSTQNAVLAGVMGGLGEFFGLDPTRLRWVYVLFSLISAGFPGILVYLALWIVIPRR